MKNFFLLPTDKPSRLYITENELFFDNKAFYRSNRYDIYITSYDYIKEGVNQWYIDSVLNELYNSGGAQYSNKQNIILLTTDQELIDDGIPSISDEFLEWYSKAFNEGVGVREYIKSNVPDNNQVLNEVLMIIEMKNAYKSGKTIQSNHQGTWKDFVPQNQVDRPNFDHGLISNWRVKPDASKFVEFVNKWFKK